MSRKPPDEHASDSAPRDSSPPPGKLLDAVGLTHASAMQRVTRATRDAIEKAGYTNLEPVSSGEEGATAVVLKAREAATQRRVALKVILDAGSERSLKQLQRERSALCADGLPASVVRYFGCIEGAGRQPVLVLEFIDGKKIHKHARDRGLSLRDRVELCRSLFEELARLHEAGMLFGDLSPNNVLVDAEGGIRFVDFGQARRIDAVYRSVNSLSGPGGTPGIASDAVLKGERRPETRDDVRAAAATAFLVLCGHRVDHDRDGARRDGRGEAEWLRDLRAARVPGAIARVLCAALRVADEAGAMPRTRGPSEAAAVADGIAGWYARRRRLALRLRMVAVVLLVAVPLALAAFDGWSEYRAESSRGQQRSAQELEREIALRPNRGHPAVAKLLAEAERGGTFDERVAALRRALATSHEIEGLEPLRASLGEVLVRTPWVRTNPAIAAREEELSKRWRELGGKVDAGEWRAAWDGLRALQGDLAQLGSDNVAASRAEQARSEYRRIERGVVARLRGHPTWAAIASRADEAERLLKAGRFDDSAGPGATTEFAQSKAQLESFLVENETAEERRVRITTDTTTIAELEKRIAALEGELAEAGRRLDALQGVLARTEAERGQIAGERDGLRGRLGAAEKERDAAESARKALAERVAKADADVGRLRSERDGALRDLAAAERLRDAAVGAHRDLSERIAKDQAASEATKAELERQRAELERLRTAKRETPPAPRVEGSLDVQPGTKLTTGIGLTMVWIAPGTFQMGSPESEEGRENDESLHSVMISRPYAIGETEVTQGQWAEIMKTRPWQGRSFVIEGADVAASYIDWNGAVEFCRRLSTAEQAAGRLSEGYEYRLPTEAEWERAARAGTNTRFAFGDGDSELRNYAVFDGARAGTHAHCVKSKRAPAWGLYDMHGNVWEWCVDEVNWSGGVVSAVYVDGAVDPWTRSGPLRTSRGGCWNASAAGCRPASRFANEPGNANGYLGFRPALAARSDGAPAKSRNTPTAEAVDSRAGTSFATRIGLTMVWIAPGTFQMGSPETEEGRDADERLHSVTISRPYAIGESEVTQGQWAEVMKTRPWHGQSLVIEGGDVAATYVTWNAAMEFCRRLTAAERAAGRLSEEYEFRLPTEAEWERAARAGTSTRFAHGDDERQLRTFAVYVDAHDGQHVHRVKSKRAPAWGLYDMQGNAWEWCADEVSLGQVVLSDTYVDGVIDPWNRGGPQRALRGGSWNYSAAICRPANRYAYEPGHGYYFLGFRPALAAKSDREVPPKSGGGGAVDTRAGTEFATEGGLTMVWVAPASFQMGSPQGEPGRDGDEQQHSVTLTRSFAIANSEVTQGQWTTLMATRPWHGRDHVIEGEDIAASHINWNDAVEFCAKLTKLELSAGRVPDGYAYRLPTEAEWEHAARAGSTGRYSFGDNENELWRFAVFAGARDGGCAHRAKSKQPNPWGLYDMHGNLWEWCADEVGWSRGVVSNTYRDGIVDPLSRGGAERACRGGCWFVTSAGCRSAYRFAFEPSYALDGIGFRPVLGANFEPEAGVPSGIASAVSITNLPTTGALPRAGTKLTTGIGLTMVWIGPGTFQMGSPETEEGRDADERLHSVTISRPYAIGETEVTRGQWAELMKTTPWLGYVVEGWQRESFAIEGADIAASYIDWNGAVEFCGRLSTAEQAAGRLSEGYEYRLPTEAEWERAARAGTNMRFAFGDGASELRNYAVFDGARVGTHAHRVKSKRASAWGLYDMHGNVWEWCADEVNSNGGVVSAVYVNGAVDPWNRGGPLRAARGGSWYDSAASCRSAYRYAHESGVAYDGLGFRPVLAARSDAR